MAKNTDAIKKNGDSDKFEVLKSDSMVIYVREKRGISTTETLIDWHEGIARGVLELMFFQNMVDAKFYTQECHELAILGRRRKDQIKEDKIKKCQI